MTRPTTLPGWLAYLETLHPKAIAMGLDRVRAVAGKLHATLACPVVTVGGTNGKGSTCALLAAVLRAGGYRVGAVHLAAPLALQRALPHRRPRRRATTNWSRRSTRSRTRASRPTRWCR